MWFKLDLCLWAEMLSWILLKIPTTVNYWITFMYSQEIQGYLEDTGAWLRFTQM